MMGDRDVRANNYPYAVQHGAAYTYAGQVNPQIFQTQQQSHSMLQTSYQQLQQQQQQQQQQYSHAAYNAQVMRQMQQQPQGIITSRFNNVQPANRYISQPQQQVPHFPGGYHGTWSMPQQQMMHPPVQQPGNHNYGVMPQQQFTAQGFPHATMYSQQQQHQLPAPPPQQQQQQQQQQHQHHHHLQQQPPPPPPQQQQLHQPQMAPMTVQQMNMPIEKQPYLHQAQAQPPVSTIPLTSSVPVYPSHQSTLQRFPVPSNNAAPPAVPRPRVKKVLDIFNPTTHEKVELSDKGSISNSPSLPAHDSLIVDKPHPSRALIVTESVPTPDVSVTSSQVSGPVDDLTDLIDADSASDIPDVPMETPKPSAETNRQFALEVHKRMTDEKADLRTDSVERLSPPTQNVTVPEVADTPAIVEESTKPLVENSQDLSLDTVETVMEVENDTPQHTEKEEEKEEIKTEAKKTVPKSEIVQKCARLKYSKEVLLALATCELAQKRPAILPLDLPDIITNQARKMIQERRDTDFLPNYVNNDRISMRTSGRQSHNRPFRQPVPPVRRNNGRPTQRIIEAPNRDKEELKRSETAYVPRFRGKNSASGPEELRRQILSILNKIAPQNFDQCMDELKNLDICTEEGLNTCIDTLFEKAVKEEAYSVTFAQICQNLSKVKVDLDEGKCVSFKSLLLNRCQKMFETPLKEQLQMVSEEWEEKVAKETDETLKKLYGDEKDEQVKKAKDKFYGNIRFIGELFLKGILSAQIIHRCISNLLRSKETESIESLCKLFETTGEKLDIQKAEGLINQYFQQIDKLINSEKVESRLKYRLMELKEMRSRGWTLRKIQEQRQFRPKTKDELEQETAQLQQEKMEEQHRMNRMKRQQPQQQYGGAMGFNEPRRKSTPMSSQRDTFAVPKQRPLDISRMALRTADTSGDIKFGPGGGSALWAQGSRGHKEEKKSADGWQTKGSSRGSSSHLQSSSRETSRSRDASPRPGSASAQTSNRSSTTSLNLLVVEEDLATMRKKAENHAKHLLSEFIAGGCLEDGALRISRPELVIESLFNHMLEEDKTTRRKVGELLFNLIKKRQLSPPDLVKGVHMVLEYAADLVIDIPDLNNYLAECLQMLLQKDDADLAFFPELLQPLCNVKKAAYVMAKTLDLAGERIGLDVIGQAFRIGCLEWSMFLHEGEDGSSLEADFPTLMQVTGPPREVTITETIEKQSELVITAIVEIPVAGHELQERLSELLHREASNDQIIEVLDKVDEHTQESSEHVEIVCRCIAQSVIDHANKSVDHEKFKNRSTILKRLVDLKEEKEIKALCSLQSIALRLNEDSTQIMVDVFDLLLSEHVISKDAFLKWESHSNPSEPGFEDTKRAVSPFLAALRSDSS